ncbi:angiopoietin-2-like [Lethenteron reissneri]|uniref:angiopoietin-2-like n=1 Tax=Lethenteron reissneri TaxID=7753 RepID=UPI002AB676D5|nr:angiopoietin-2-like [Lethenteron reissneri]
MNPVAQMVSSAMLLLLYMWALGEPLGTHRGARAASSYRRVRGGLCTYTFVIPPDLSACASLAQSMRDADPDEEDSDRIHNKDRTRSPDRKGDLEAASPVDGDVSKKDLDETSERIQQLESALGNATLRLHKLESTVREAGGARGHSGITRSLQKKVLEQARNIQTLQHNNRHLERKITELESRREVTRRKILNQQPYTSTTTNDDDGDDDDEDDEDDNDDDDEEEEDDDAHDDDDKNNEVSIRHQSSDESQPNNRLLHGGKSQHNTTAVQGRARGAQVTSEFRGATASGETGRDITVRGAAIAGVSAGSGGPYQDCAEIYRSGQTRSGIYVLHVFNTSHTLKVYCDMQTEGGGWTVFQRREDGHINFNRPWQDYKLGFGSADREYWLGNEAVHVLTSRRPQALRILLWDWDENQAYASYARFTLRGEAARYRLLVSGFSGTAGRYSSLVQSGAEFSTRDQDHDRCQCKCAQLSSGGWWFEACGPSNLNGQFFPKGSHYGHFNGIKWHYWRGASYSLKASTMMIRPADF